MTVGGEPQPPGASKPATPSDSPAASTVSIYNIANLLTLLRIVLVPVFIWLLFLHGVAWRSAALGVFILASVTDRIDGQLARRYNLITDFGKIADPIADKALTGAALIGLSALGDLWWWVTVVILVRELGITLLRFVVIRYGVIPASKGGKLKTMLQILAIGFFICPGPAVVLNVIRWPLMAAALVVTVVTGLDYLLEAYRLTRRARLWILKRGPGRKCRRGGVDFPHAR